MTQISSGNTCFAFSSWSIVLLVQSQKTLEDVVLDSVLTSAFDATPEKLEAARKPLKASLHAMALKAAR